MLIVTIRKTMEISGGQMIVLMLLYLLSKARAKRVLREVEVAKANQVAAGSVGATIADRSAPSGP